jgi:hypothetical protein
MALADIIAQEMSAKERSCRMANLLTTLTDTDRQAVENAIEMVRDRDRGGASPQGSRVTGSAIYRALVAEGHDVTVYVVQAHIYGRCSCVV